MARKDIIKTQKIKEDIKRWDDHWSDNNKRYYERTDFIWGQQWEKDQEDLFKRNEKVPLTVNKLASLANYLLGEQMRNTPNLQVEPSDDVDVQTAATREALVKNIAFNSDSSTVYETAFEHAIIGCYGAWRVDTEYDNDYSFDQNLVIRKFNDPTKCYWDISAENRCKTDGMYAGFRTRVSRRKFRSMYGKKLEASIGESDAIDGVSPFSDDKSITIIDHFEREYDTVKIYQLSTGDIIEDKEYKTLEHVQIDEHELLMYKGQPVTVVKERETYRYKIQHYQAAGDYILEETDFPTKQLPIVFLDQKSYYDKSGKQICRSFFEDVIDTQIYLNYLATQSAYTIKVSRYDQFIISKENARSPDTQEIWQDPTVRKGALYYDESPSGDRPQQLTPPELSSSLLTQYQRALDDLQSGTGIYSTQLGQQGNEAAGVAIDARTNRSSYNIAVPLNSLKIAVACTGQLIDEAIPKVYDSERTMRLTMKDQNEKPVTINKQIDDYGTNVENDMSKGRYKIRLVAGPSFEGQKEQGLLALKDVIAADKSGNAFTLIADLYAENLPLPNTLELRNRLRTVVPQEVIEAGKTGQPLPPKPPQPDPQMILAQLKEKEIAVKQDQIQQQAAQKMQELEIKKSEIQRKAIEAHSEMMVEWQRIEAEKEEAAAELQGQMLRIQAEFQRTQTDADIAHANNLVKILTHQPKLNEGKHV